MEEYNLKPGRVGSQPATTSHKYQVILTVRIIFTVYHSQIVKIADNCTSYLL